MKESTAKERLKMSYDAFDFLMISTREEIFNLGWRLGEKLDSFYEEDFRKEYIDPLIQGIEEGSGKSGIMK